MDRTTYMTTDWSYYIIDNAGWILGTNLQYKLDFWNGKLCWCSYPIKLALANVGASSPAALATQTISWIPTTSCFPFPTSGALGYKLNIIMVKRGETTTEEKNK